VLVDVETVDTSTTMMGQRTSVPFFICPTGMSKMAHAAGEPGLAAAAGENDVIQMVSRPCIPLGPPFAPLLI
jgi:L-lactate dehydrogenase (cytochrome)